MMLNLEIEHNNLNTDFLRIATDLMNSWILKVENAHYRITEIEFYFKSKLHNDSYIHGHELQQELGRWYFHGSGIDLTFGSDDILGGILIRAVYNIKTKKYVYGPLNIITELFSHLPSVYESAFSFGLIPNNNDEIEFEKPISAPRVGLNPNKDADMYDKCYRFLVMPRQKHAEKTRIAEAMEQQKYNEEEIKNIWG